MFAYLFYTVEGWCIFKWPFEYIPWWWPSHKTQLFYTMVITHKNWCVQMNCWPNFDQTWLKFDNEFWNVTLLSYVWNTCDWLYHVDKPYTDWCLNRRSLLKLLWNTGGLFIFKKWNILCIFFFKHTYIHSCVFWFTLTRLKVITIYNIVYLFYWN